ncbi:DUF5990 family protein [Streptomyces hydrogenans]|uniref:DUF5990 family protein n=1 Tax=Streptomyces hydrogenans TaxID=1873719 RepID=UPI0035E10A2C
MEIRIEAFGLPGRTCAAAPGFPGYEDVHVAVQRRGRADELLGPQPGDAASATWTLDCTATATDAGVDIRGPYVQGCPGGRFVYLSWGSLDGAGTFTMFRRAKLMLDAIAPDTAAAALRSGRLVARLRLSDDRGLPLCAQVRPPRVDWTAAAAD